jgi:hypothetical protein
LFFQDLNSRICEVIDMTDKRIKPVTKKATTVKAGSAVAGKPKATKNAVTKNAVTKKPTITTGKPAVKPTPEERYRMVETAAYFIAEQHGFQGRSDEHWAAAEHEIAARLGQ